MLLAGSVASLPVRGRQAPKETGADWLTGATETVRYLESREVSENDKHLLDQAAVEELFSRYLYRWRGSLWRYREIVSPLIKHFAVFAFHASDGLDDYSELTLAISRDGKQMFLIPIANHSMVAYPHVEDDPHNMAIFNALIAAESIHPAGPTEWFGLGLLYVNLVSERLQLADWEDYAGHRHAGMLTLLPRLRDLKLLPRVTCGTAECEVQIVDLHPDVNHWVVWELDFDAQSNPRQLTFVSKEIQP